MQIVKVQHELTGVNPLKQLADGAQARPVARKQPTNMCKLNFNTEMSCRVRGYLQLYHLLRLLVVLAVYRCTFYELDRPSLQGGDDVEQLGERRNVTHLSPASSIKSNACARF